MPHDQWTRVKGLVADALELDPHERDSYLESACAGDAALRTRALALLRLEAGAGRFLEQPPTLVRDAGASTVPTEGDRRVGRYTLGSLVASGASGDVFEAMQDDPARRVALKVLRGNVRASRVSLRFRRESEILARLRHPGIAQVFEAGIAPFGGVNLAYFAMELVPDAQTITAYADAQGLDTEARIGLVIEVCHAVAHAHERGIVHRDLKPANILVGSDGVPKVIDFGVARVLYEDDESPTIRTEAGDIIGTLPYMSPEQCGTDPGAIDARCDVYALGAVLFELLAGRLPLEVTGLPLDDAVRTIRLVMPPRASSVRPGLGADTDAVLARALAKERTDRYASVSELAADLRRVLDHQPVSARRPGMLHGARLFAKRNRVGVAGAGVVALVLVGATIVSTVFAVRADRSAKREAYQRSVAEGVTAETERFFAAPVPFREDMAVDIRDRLDELTAQWDESPPTDPLVEARLRHRIAHTWMEYRRPDKALPQYERAIALFEQVNPRSLEHALALTHYAITIDSTKDFERSEAIYRRALDIRRRIPGDGAPDPLSLLSNLTTNLSMRGHREAAEPLFHEIIRLREKRDGRDHLLTVGALHELARLHMAEGDDTRAVDVLRDALDRARRSTDDSHPIVAALLSKLGIASRLLGDLDASRAYLAESWAIALAHRTPGTPDWNFLLHEYTKTLEAVGDIDGAVDAINVGIRKLEERLGVETDEQKVRYVGGVRDRFDERRRALAGVE